MGPQSSGKSTLLNHFFGNNFGEMDAFKGRHLLLIFSWWCQDIGREQAANKPLLKTVFQVIHVCIPLWYGILFLSHKKITQSCQSNEDQIPSKEDVSWRTKLLETHGHPKI
ncbi:hypothetical protein Patl1_11275 [Pistacia atlantica]|uniref:Uncharacterized protein n=1 Tax=Pistacia atlantica TaxID=434234 RepID=A0ACC1A8Q0_9ROSI|nr:hypothetical protein Patl1_11275 [Pistacia atlantica]